MRFSTAFRVSGVFVLALAAEVLAAYFLYSNYAYDLANSGDYTVQEAYASGPIGPVVKAFYVLFAVTAAAALIPPVIAAVSFAFRRHTPPRPGANESPRVMPPPHPDHIDRFR